MIFPKVSSVPGQKAPDPLPGRNCTRRRARPRGVLPGPWLLPGRSEAEHPGAAGGEIWAGHHERSLTGEKQRKSWGPATREPRGRRGNSRFLQRGNTLQRPPSGRGHVPQDPPLSSPPSTPAEGAVPGSRRPSHCAWGSNSRNPRLQG